MIENTKEISEIKRIVDRYLLTLERRPQMIGPIEEIESSFFLLDQINIILTYGVENNDKDLSWRAFILFKGIVGENENAAKWINKDSDPYSVLVRLRKEYSQWVEMKISHKSNPTDSPLIELLEQVDERQACELMHWFSKYPSEKAICIYSDRINNSYDDFPEISKGLARMGDKKVYKWAKNKLACGEINSERKLAIECIAVSPLEEADNTVRDIIQSSQVDDIDLLVCALGNSANKNKFERIDQIISLPNRPDILDASIELVLGTLIHENESKSIELRKKLKGHKN